MQEQGRAKSEHGLSAHGIRNANTIWWNLSTPALYEHAVQRHEGMVAHLGPLVVRTGQYTGGSPQDRYIVSGHRRHVAAQLAGAVTVPCRVLDFRRIDDIDRFV